MGIFQSMEPRLTHEAMGKLSLTKDIGSNAYAHGVKSANCAYFVAISSSFVLWLPVGMYQDTRYLVMLAVVCK